MAICSLWWIPPPGTLCSRKWFVHDPKRWSRNKSTWLIFFFTPFSNKFLTSFNKRWHANRGIVGETASVFVLFFWRPLELGCPICQSRPSNVVLVDHTERERRRVFLLWKGSKSLTQSYLGLLIFYRKWTKHVWCKLCEVHLPFHATTTTVRRHSVVCFVM